MMAGNYKANAKDYHLSQAEANKRYKDYEQLNHDLLSLKRVYDNLLHLKINQKDNNP